MKNRKKLISLGLSALMILGLAGCSNKTEEPSTEETVKVGVLTYNSTDSEMSMFRSYLKDYLGNAFGVEYYYADAITSLEDEKEFIDQAKEAGCQGVIAFVSNNLEEIVDYCGEDMFYALQNMTPTVEEFEAIKDKPQFLGVVSPSNDAEYEAGAGIVKSLMGDSADSSGTWLVFTGGASYGNNMHTQRSKGSLDVLTASGYELKGTADDLLTTEAPMLAAVGKDGGEVYICPGYPSVFTENVDQALSMCEADYIVSSCSLENNEEQIENYRNKLAKEVKLGLVDCFSETVSEAVSSDKINSLSGKYAAMVAPSFIAMMNAVSDNLDIVKKDGQAYWINQDMWSADSKEEFQKLYSESVNIYDNLYSTEDLMDLIGVYNTDASYENFIEMTEIASR